MSESAPPVSSTAPASDAGLDATHTGDRAYMHQLGYRQELRRALGFFSSFAVQWTCIAVAGGLALSMGAGIIQVGGVFFFAWLIGGGLQMIVGLAVAEGVSACVGSRPPARLWWKRCRPRLIRKSTSSRRAIRCQFGMFGSNRTRGSL